jgi:hypothetical protein
MLYNFQDKLLFLNDTGLMELLEQKDFDNSALDT